MKYKDAHKIPLLNEELLAINGSWGKRASVFFTGVHHTPVDDPTPRYIPAALMRLNGLKKKDMKLEEKYWAWVLEQLKEWTVYIYD